MRKYYNNFQEIDNDIRILQLQKDIAVAKMQNRVQSVAEHIKGDKHTPILFRLAKVTQQIIVLRKNQIIGIAAEFLFQKWLLRKTKHKK